MRIVSMLSSATEIVYALGLQDHLVAISHECDYPPRSQGLPRASRSRFDPTGLTSGEIDAEVRRCMQQWGSVYEVDRELLRSLRPDVVLTQAVCEVCAVPTGSVHEAVAGLPTRPEVVSLDAHSLEDILATLQQVADVMQVPERGHQAVDRLRERVRVVREQVAGQERPRVLALEWLDPPFAPGHWVPEIVEHAGGANLLGTAGGHSAEVGWEQIAGLDPDCLLLLPCGWNLEQARADADRARDRLGSVAGRAVQGGAAWIGHGSYFSRSGPRVVDGIEALAHVLHPSAFPNPPAAGRLEAWQ
jgi:iron complex transport system substrate-binding protein